MAITLTDILTFSFFLNILIKHYLLKLQETDLANNFRDSSAGEFTQK